MERETKVSLEVSTSTLQMIEKAKERLSKKTLFEWLKHLSTEDFLNFFFGFSEVSQFCRKTFLETLEEITSEGLPILEEKKPISAVEEKKPIEKLGYISSLMQKVIDEMKKSEIPRTMRQVSESSNVPLRSVEWILSDLSKKGIVSRVPQTHEWKLNPEVAEKYEVRGLTVRERILDLLKTTKEPLSTEVISNRLSAKRRTVSYELWGLLKEDKVERIPVRHNLTEWKLKQQ